MQFLRKSETAEAAEPLPMPVWVTALEKIQAAGCRNLINGVNSYAVA